MRSPSMSTPRATSYQGTYPHLVHEVGWSWLDRCELMVSRETDPVHSTATSWWCGSTERLFSYHVLC